MEIQDKAQIKAALRQSFGAVVYASNQYSDEDFLVPRAPGKWSAGDIVGHLVLTTKLITKGMSAPKELLKASFGLTEKDERSFEEVLEHYNTVISKGVNAPSTVIFNDVAGQGKDGMIKILSTELEKMISQLDNWKEHELSSYLMPHPALGKLTIREMLYFNHIHTLHHHKQMI